MNETYDTTQANASAGNEIGECILCNAPTHITKSSSYFYNPKTGKYVSLCKECGDHVGEIIPTVPCSICKDPWIKKNICDKKKRCGECIETNIDIFKHRIKLAKLS